MVICTTNDNRDEIYAGVIKPGTEVKYVIAPNDSDKTWRHDLFIKLDNGKMARFGWDSNSKEPCIKKLAFPEKGYIIPDRINFKKGQ